MPKNDDTHGRTRGAQALPVVIDPSQNTVRLAPRPPGPFLVSFVIQKNFPIMQSKKGERNRVTRLSEQGPLACSFYGIQRAKPGKYIKSHIPKDE